MLLKKTLTKYFEIRFSIKIKSVMKALSCALL